MLEYLGLTLSLQQPALSKTTSFHLASNIKWQKNKWHFIAGWAFQEPTDHDGSKHLCLHSGDYNDNDNFQESFCTFAQVNILLVLGCSGKRWRRLLVLPWLLFYGAGVVICIWTHLYYTSLCWREEKVGYIILYFFPPSSPCYFLNWRSHRSMNIRWTNIKFFFGFVCWHPRFASL